MTYARLRQLTFKSTKSNSIMFTQPSSSTVTNGTLISTGSTWIDHATAGQCAVKLLCSNSATTGDYATLRIRGRSDAAGATVAINASASAGANDFGNLYAVQGYAQPNAYTQAGASNIVCGLYSCIDATTTSSGRRWSTWIDDHSTTKAGAGHYLLRMSDNGTTAKDGAITIYSGGRLPVLFNFEEAIAGGFLTDSGTPGSTAAGYIAVKTPAGTKYISLFTA